VVAGVGFEPT